jgi:hypothetical protein
MTVMFNVERDSAGDLIQGKKVSILLLSGGNPAYGDGYSIEAVGEVITDDNGRWEKDLVPNNDLIPTGTVYSAKLAFRNGDIVHTFTVPDTSGPHWVGDFLSDTPGILPNPALDDHLLDDLDAHDASSISVIPVGGITAVDVQSALGELEATTAHLSSGAAETIGRDWYYNTDRKITVAVKPQLGDLDHTTAFIAAVSQAAVDGSDIEVLPSDNPYMLETVPISKPNLHWKWTEGVKLKRKPGINVADASKRAMFTVVGGGKEGLVFDGGARVDLNRSAYNNGDSAAFLYAERATQIWISGWPHIEHSSENSFTIFGCGHIYAEGVWMDDAFNNHFEINFPPYESMPDPEWFRVWGYIGHVDDGLEGVGNACGIIIANAATENLHPRHFDFEVFGDHNQRDIHAELNAAGSYCEDVTLKVHSESPLYGSCALVHIKGLKADVTVHNAGSQPGGDTYGIILSGVESDAIINAKITDDRAHPTQYTKSPVQINSATSVVLESVVVKQAAHVDQAVPPVGIRASQISGSVVIGSADLSITNAPAGAKGMDFISVGYVVFGPNSITGYPIPISGLSNYQGFVKDDLVTNGNFIPASGDGGIRSDTLPGTDSKIVKLAGGGGHTDARGAMVWLYGANAGGQLDMRSWVGGFARIIGGDNVGLLVDPSGTIISHLTLLRVMIGAEVGIRFDVNGLVLSSSAGKLAFFGGLPRSQGAAIPDADGTLADVTAKLNAVLNRLRDSTGFSLIQG